ncbi:MAG TPA: S49 family peptidase, partial [Polyangiaceae bacterium]
MKKRWLAVLGTCLGVGPRPAAAQVRPGEPLRLPAFDSSVASSSTSEGVAVNPAGLAFLPGTELRLTSRYLDDASLETAQGHAVTSAFQVPLVSLSTALRLDLVDPPTRAARRSFGTNANYQWLTWGLAYQPWAGVAVGLSLQGSWSSRPELDGLKSWSLGTVLRASDVLSVGFVGQDLNRPEGPSDVRVNPSYHAALSLRPLATRAVELELGTAYVDASPGYWLPRAALGVDVPGLGRVSGDFALRDPTEERGERRWQAGLSVRVRLEGSALSAELGAGSVVGDALGPDAEWHAHQNVATTIAARGFRERPAIATSEYALRIRLDEAPSPRRHVALLRRLWAIAEQERDVQAVVLQIRAAAAGSLAHIEELRDAINLLRSRGKQVLCQLEDAGGATLYLCSAADRIVMTPSGRLRFAGFSSRYFYVPELLDKLGVEAEYARIGAHKSAPEMFSHRGASDVAAADHKDLLQQFERQMIWGIAVGRQLDPLELRRRLAQGPFSAEEARRAGLIDRVAHGDELEGTLSTDAG